MIQLLTTTILLQKSNLHSHFIPHSHLLFIFHCMCLHHNFLFLQHHHFWNLLIVTIGNVWYFIRELLFNVLVIFIFLINVLFIYLKLFFTWAFLKIIRVIIILIYVASTVSDRWVFLIEFLITFIVNINHQWLLSLVNLYPQFNCHQWVTHIFLNMIFGCMETTKTLVSCQWVNFVLPFQIIHLIDQLIHHK